MSYVPELTKGKIFVAQAAILQKRVLAADGTPLVQADVASIAYTIYDMEDEAPRTPVATGSLVKTSVIFDTYQSDYHWAEDVDAIGHNFRWIASGTTFSAANHTYRVEVVITDTPGGNKVPLVFLVTTVHLYSEE